MSEKPIRLAATLMIVSENQNVLMVRRNENIVFAGGAYVFPGGRINPSDIEHCDDALGADSASIASSAHSLQEGEAAAKIAAIRETFEETGILFAKNANQEWANDGFATDVANRKKIEADPEYFFEFLKMHKLTLAPERLAAIAIWQPPENIAKRFLTWFFVAIVERELNAVPDGNEAVEALWINPQTAFNEAMSRQKHIIFPTRCNLALLAHYNPPQKLMDYALSRSAPLINPKPQKINGEMMLFIPDNIGYPHYCEPLANVRD